MPRPTPSLASAVAALSHAASAGCPAWVTPDAWRALALAVHHLTRDARTCATTGTRVAAARALHVHRDTLDDWLRRGWLSGGGR